MNTIDDAINAAIAVIQDSIGQTDGGFAAHYLSGERLEALRTILTDYAAAEITHRMTMIETTVPATEADKWEQCDAYAELADLLDTLNPEA
jgi:hypothetical protein